MHITRVVCVWHSFPAREASRLSRGSKVPLLRQCALCFVPARRHRRTEYGNSSSQASLRSSTWPCSGMASVFGCREGRYPCVHQQQQRMDNQGLWLPQGPWWHMSQVPVGLPGAHFSSTFSSGWCDDFARGAWWWVSGAEVMKGRAGRALREGVVGCCFQHCLLQAGGQPTAAA